MSEFTVNRIMWKITISCTILGLAAAWKVTFDNYKVFRLTPTTEQHINVLRRLKVSYNNRKMHLTRDATASLDNYDIFYDFFFWREPSVLHEHVDVMIAPYRLSKFQDIISKMKIPYEIFIENVQALVKKTVIKQSTTFDFTSYHTLDEIYKNLDDLAKQYPDKVQTIVGGHSYENRQIKGVHVSFKENNPGVFIEGGIHAREWISPATVMYILHQLLISNNTDVRAMAESYDWYIFPVFNPDGYVYTHTKNRMWRKTRKPSSDFCIGSDLNRNWDYRWNTGGANSNPCSETYPGSEPFSEVEAKSMSELIETIKDKFDTYISFHSFWQKLMFPYGYTKDHLENYDEEYAIGTKAIEALEKRYGTKYKTENIAESAHIVTGNTCDYIKGVYGKRLCYVYELRDEGRYGFLLPPEQIIPTGEETLDSLVALFQEAEKLGFPDNCCD